MMNLNLNLREMSWNYINEKGLSFMKIELQNINFRMTEKEQQVETVFHVGALSVYDLVF